MSETDLEISVRDQTLVLMHERAAFWREAGILLVADPHFGKAASFRASGIPVPSGTTDEGLSRLTAIVSRTNPKLIVFLGDLLHAREGRSTGMLSALAEWRRENTQIDLMLVRGNHDRRAGDPPGELGMSCVDAPFLSSPFVLAHHPVQNENGYVIAGHVHPGVRLYGTGRQRERLPCFVFGESTAVMPAFGDFTGLADADPDSSARIYAIADTAVIEVAQN